MSSEAERDSQERAREYRKISEVIKVRLVEHGKQGSTYPLILTYGRVTNPARADNGSGMMRYLR